MDMLPVKNRKLMETVIRFRDIKELRFVLFPPVILYKLDFLMSLLLPFVL